MSFGVFFVLLLATFVKNGSCNAATEASELAIEVSGELLAPEELTQKFTKELTAIRTAYPVVRNVYHTPPWKVGELLAQLSDEQLEQIRMQYGEVTSSPLFDDYKTLVFTRQYNPEVLAKELTSKKLVKYAEPNNVIGISSSVHYHNPTGEYTFIQGWGDCPSGCISNHFWEFAVSQTGKVTLLKEFGAPLASAEK